MEPRTPVCARRQPSGSLKPTKSRGLRKRKRMRRNALKGKRSRPPLMLSKTDSRRSKKRANKSKLIFSDKKTKRQTKRTKKTKKRPKKLSPSLLLPSLSRRLKRRSHRLQL